MNPGQSELSEDTTPVAGVPVLVLGVLAIIAGVMLATYVLPLWLPGLTSSMTGESPKVFWYLSRGTAFVAFALLWASMALGLIITNKLARLWPSGPVAFELHQYTSLLGLGFALFHATILIGDEYIHLDLWRVFAPFASQNYEPFWVGLGQISFYLWGLLVGSFYVRKQIGTKAWRWIHFSSFMTFALVMAHGIISGTDTKTSWASMMYWLAGGSLLFLLYYRRSAGEVLMLQFVRALKNQDRFEAIEPGVVRQHLLNMRTVMDQGVSLADAGPIFKELNADLILSGRRLDFEELEQAGAAPRVDFSLDVFERRSGRTVWSAKSQHRGDEDVLLFDWKRVSTANVLAERMVSRVVEKMASE